MNVRISVLVLALALLTPAALAGNGRGGGNRVPAPAPTLSPAERDALLFLREEEKLARDVYRALGDEWGLPIFSHIAASEQRHMDAVLGLLERYGVADPAAGKAEGEFANPALKALHDDLVEKGLRSVEDALIVGATIEDMDIADLHEDLALSGHADVTAVLENLMRGSRNHLRAFARMMDAYDVSYVPQHISQAEYDEIVGSATETGGPGRRRRGRR
jgi:hypothetical protein